MWKRYLTILLATGLILSLGVGSLAAEKTVIEFWDCWQIEGLHDVLIADFERENPDIKVAQEKVSGGSLQKMMLAVASGNTPDVLEDYIGRVPIWWFEGVLRPLNDTLTEEDREDFNPSLMDLHTIDGNLFAYPRFYWFNTWGGNITVMERAGVAAPQGLEWEWNDFMTAIRKIDELTDVYPLVFWANGYDCDQMTLMNFLMQGASLYENGDYTQTTLNSEAGVRALEWMMEMTAMGYAPPGVAGLDGGAALGMIRMGKAVFGWWPDAPTVQKTFDKGEIDYIPEFGQWAVPSVPGVPDCPIFSAGSAIAVLKGDVEEAAIRFVKYWVGKEALTKLANHTEDWSWGIPRKSIASSPMIAIPQAIALKNGFGDLGLNSPHYNEARDLQAVALQEAFTGRKSAKQALDDFAEKVAALWK